MKQAIQCKYSCFKCGIKRQIVTVQARADEDVVAWMNNVAVLALVADHKRRSPHCRIEKFDEVMIPLFKDSPNVGSAGTIPASDEGVN